MPMRRARRSPVQSEREIVVPSACLTSNVFSRYLLLSVADSHFSTLDSGNTSLEVWIENYEKRNVDKRSMKRKRDKYYLREMM